MGGREGVEGGGLIFLPQKNEKEGNIYAGVWDGRARRKLF